MSFWDSLKQKIARAGQNISDMADRVGGMEQSVPQGTLRVGGASLTPAQAATPAEIQKNAQQRRQELAESGQDTLGMMAIRNWNRVISTGILLGNEDTFKDQDSYLGAVKKAWNASPDISPGQAFQDTLLDAFNVKTWDSQDKEWRDNLNIYDDQEVEQIYESGSAKPWSRDFNPNRLFSGASDLAFAIFADPFVVTGKGASLARKKVLDPELNILDDYKGQQRAKYEAEIKKQGRYETVLEQQQARRQQLQERLTGIELRIAEAENAAVKELGPEPTIESARFTAEQMLKDGTERQVLVEAVDGRDLGFNKMNNVEQQLYEEYGVIPMRLIRQQLDPNVPMASKPFGPYGFDEFYAWFRTGSPERGLGQGEYNLDSPWGISEYEGAAISDPRKPLTKDQLRGKKTITRKNKDGSFTTYDRTTSTGNMYVEVPWLRGGKKADIDELEALTDRIHNENLDMYYRAIEGYEPAIQEVKRNWAAERERISSEITSLRDTIAQTEAKINNIKSQSMPRLARNMDHFVQQVIKYDMKADDIARHRWIARWSADPQRAGQIIEYAAKSADPTDIVDAMLVMQGDQVAFDRLIARRELLARSIDRLRGEKSIVQRTLDSGQNFVPLTDMRATDYMNDLSRELDLLIQEDEFLRSAVGEFSRNADGTIKSAEDTGFGILAAARGPSKITGIESLRARRAMRKNYYSFAPVKSWRPWQAGDDWDLVPYQANPLLRPVYLAEFIGSNLGKELPTGIVPLRGLETFEIGPEMVSWLNSVKAWNTKEGAAIKRDWFNRVNNAPQFSMDPRVPNRQQVLEEMEEAAFRSELASVGIDPNAYRQRIEQATLDKKWADVRLLRAEEKAAEQFIQGLSTKYRQERAIAAENMKKMGFAVTEDDGLILNKFLSSQAADLHFLPDMGMWASYVADNAQLFKSHINKQTFNDLDTGALKEIKEAAKPLGEQWKAIYNEFDRVWRPSVLLRFGYTQRNLLTELLKVYAVLDNGVIDLYKKAPEAASNWAKNRWDRFYRMKAAAVQNKTLAEAGREVAGSKYRVNVKEYTDFLKDQVEIAYANLDVARLTNDPKLIEEASVNLAKARQDADDFGKFVTREGQQGNRYATGRKTVVIGDTEVAGAYGGGAEGDIFRSLVSSNARMAKELAPLDSRVTAEQRNFAESGSWGALRPDAPNYWEELAGIANRQFRNSKVLKFMAQGKSDEFILAFLRSKEGRIEMAKINWADTALRNEWGQGPEGYLSKIKDSYGRYLPTDEAKSLWLRAVAENKQVTAQQLQAAIPTQKAGVIHGRIWEEIKEKTTIEKLVDLRPFSDEKGSSFVAGAGGAAAFGGGDFTSLGGVVGGVAGAVLGNKWTAFTQKAFKYLGSLPEDAFIRHPFANVLYEGEMARMLSRQIVDKEALRPDTIARMQTAARKYALRETRSLLYSIIRKSSAANTLVVLSPFAQAQLHTLKAWSRIGYERPERLGRLASVYARVQMAEFTEQDPITGKRYVTMKMPESWWKNTNNRLLPDFVEKRTDKFLQPVRDMLRGKDELAFPIQSFNLLMPGWRGDDLATGFIQSFGIGPVVTLAVGEALKKFPDLDAQLTETFGIPIPAENILEAFVPRDTVNNASLSSSLLPPVLRRIQSTIGGLRETSETAVTSAYDGPADFAFHLKYFYDYRYAREQLGIDPTLTDEQRWTYARKDTAYFFGMRLVANLTSGFIPQYNGALTPYVKIWQQYQNEDPAGAFDKFYRDYPEFITITASLTENKTGSSATSDAVFMFRNNKEVISDVADQLGPEFVQMGTNRQFFDLEYDPAARVWQIENEFRGTISPKEAIDNVQIRKGWADYKNEMLRIQAELQRRGLYSIAQKGAEDLRQYKADWLAYQQTANPQWFLEGWSVSDREGWRKSIQAVRAYLADDKFMSYQPDDSWFTSAESYLRFRDGIEKELQRRKRLGGSDNIDAQSNSDLVFARDLEVTRLSNLDPTFAKMYYRFFDNDKFLPVYGEVVR